MEIKTENPEIQGDFSADERGRITLGKEYADKEFRVVAELKNQEDAADNN